MATINRTGNDYANNLIPCVAGIGAGDGHQERLPLYVKVRIGIIDEVKNEKIRRECGQSVYQCGEFTLEGFYGVDPVR